MKTMLLLAMVMFFNLNLVGQSTSKVETLTTFLDGITAFQEADFSEAEPLADIKILADTKAAKKIVLTKESIQTALDELANYNKAIIIVGNHTIVKITDHKNCKASGAWGAFMPFGKGLIQKAGVFEPSEDYINNIIGIPDGQERILYLLN